MSNAFDLYLHLLRCVKGQEGDGDEIYLKLDDEIIWTWQKAGHKMSPYMVNSSFSAAYDFRTASAQTSGGWERTAAYDPEQFIFRSRTKPVTLELWEADQGEPLRGADDLLGSIHISVHDIQPGEQRAFFQQRNVDYELTYRVVAAGS